MFLGLQLSPSLEKPRRRGLLSCFSLSRSFSLPRRGFFSGTAVWDDNKSCFFLRLLILCVFWKTNRGLARLLQGCWAVDHLCNAIHGHLGHNDRTQNLCPDLITCNGSKPRAPWTQTLKMRVVKPKQWAELLSWPEGELQSDDKSLRVHRYKWPLFILQALLT